MLDSGGYGGSEVFLQSLSEEFRKRSVKTEFLAVNYIDTYGYLKKKNEKVSVFNFRMDLAGDIKGFLKSVFLLPYAIYKYNQTISSYPSGTVAMLTGTTDKIILTPLFYMHKHLVFWIEYAPILPILNRFFGIPKFFYRVSCRWVKRIFVPTLYAKKIWIESGIFGEDILEVIPLGIKINHFDQNKKRLSRERARKELDLGDSFVVGMISRLEKEKGQDTLIDIAKKTKHTNIKYLIAGVGGNYEFLKKAISTSDLGSNVKLLGFYPEDKKWDLYNAFDVFVFPTRWKYEGWGLVLQEAMMMGVPIISSDFGPVPEVVGSSVILIKDGIQDYIKAIVKLAEDKKMYERHVDLGLKRVNELSIQKTAKKYLSVMNFE